MARTGSQVYTTDWNYAPPVAGILNTTVAVTIKGAVSGQRNYLTGLQLTSEVLGTATELALRDGAGGTVLWRCKLPAAGGIPLQPLIFDPPLKGTAGNLLEVVTLTASGTGAVYVNAQGFTQ